jgi:hypothetical protein
MLGHQAGNIVLGLPVSTELPRDEARQELDGEQVIDPVQLPVELQVAEGMTSSSSTPSESTSTFVTLARTLFASGMVWSLLDKRKRKKAPAVIVDLCGSPVCVTR